MPTPGSWPTAYATGKMLCDRADFRTISQLLADDGKPVSATGDSAQDRVAVEQHPTLKLLLQEASGMIEAAATVGKRYVIDPYAQTPRNDLLDLLKPLPNTHLGDITAEMEGAGLGDLLLPTPTQVICNSGHMLIGMTVGITLWLLWERRPQRIKDLELPARATIALKMLDDLREGKTVFGWQENQDDSTLKSTIDTPQDFEARGGASIRARRYFGRRGADYPR